MITLITYKILWKLPAFQQKLTKGHFWGKITGIFLANIKNHNFGMKTLIDFK